MSQSQHESNLFPIHSVGKFVDTIKFLPKKLKIIATEAADFYSPFEKKRPSKKSRLIDNPVSDLKIIQAKINRHILQKIKLPKFIMGGVKGCRVADCVRIHSNNNVVVTLDIVDCYPRILAGQVYKIWKDLFGCIPPVAKLATELTTIDGRLAFGAPTSNALANLALLKCLVRVDMIAKDHKMNFTQWVDDSIFSGRNLADDFITKVVKEFSRHNFKISRKKKKVMRSDKLQEVLGLSANYGVSIPRSTVSMIRSAVFKIERMPPSDITYPFMYRSVLGRIHAIRRFKPNVARQLLERVKRRPKP